jgi:hypothetical protein
MLHSSMSQRTHVIPVACEFCRKWKTRVCFAYDPERERCCEMSNQIQCDDATPIRGPCRSRVAQCVYSSNPGMCRLAALKSEHK